ncbi:MAG: molybdenum cofactor guanylyltransferase [Candidatus Bathyarchaeia archaeon]
MMKTAIILAGGYSERFGKDKGLIFLSDKPLVVHVFEKICKIVDEIIVVVNSVGQRDIYSPLFSEETKTLVDIEDSHCSLVGALTGFMNATGDYSVLLPCDTPFISREVIEMLFDISSNMNAVIPRWPNGYIEPLQAVYLRKKVKKECSR